MTAIGAMLRRDLPPEELIETARAIAPLLDELWIVEDLDWPGGVAQLAAVLEATDDDTSGRPVVGHGVAPAPFRNPAALAMEWASLARMYPARLHAGIGHGVPGWMGRIGGSVESPLTLLRETIESVRAILRGGEVSYDGRYVHLEAIDLRFPPEIVPPVLAGVIGPRSLELSGAVADGTLLCEGHDAGQIAAARGRIAAGRSEDGAPAEHRFTQYVGYFLGAEDDLPPPPTDGPEGGWAAVSEDADEMATLLQGVIDVGVDSLVLVPFGPTIEQLRRFETDVRPRLRLAT
ncbi:MAG: LLM class flavin-dependent oxidoreductase [Actinomycetota bacterium]